MIKIKDTTNLDTDQSFMEKKLKKVSNNYLFFKKRARSRSFIKSADLLPEEDKHIDHNNSDFGVNTEGKKYKYAPNDVSINKQYTEIKILSDEILSPSIITLMTQVDNGRVSFSDILQIFKTIEAHQFSETSKDVMVLSSNFWFGYFN